MTDIPIPEVRLRQLLRVARMLAAVAITRADMADRARLAGHYEFAAQVEASAIAMGREALSAVVFLQDLLAQTGPDTTETTEG
ncbi:hypothetical protein [Telmatospirillum sp. J64-1]|uniref:hypothetical protein n=1 Tax=Telmatospirillum sp. J64-1 TaxID=2502183 RepID=UPI00115CAE61|nr:hypothetical protein [Telmatospirillum sp. J64-1]